MSPIRLRQRHVAVLAVATLVLWCTGCVDEEAALLPPIANAGIGQVVAIGTVATLDGSGSRAADGSTPDDLEYAWSIASTPEGSTTSLSNAAFEQSEVLIDVAGEFMFRLEVTHRGVVSRPDFVIVRGYQGLEVVSQTPPPGALGVAVDAPVVVRFSEPIQPESLGTVGVHVLANSDLIDGALEVSEGNRAVIFRPREPYPVDSLVTIGVVRTVVSVGGSGLPARYQGNFVTGGPTDQIRPAIRAVSPPDGASSVPASIAVVVDFGEPVDPDTVTPDANGDGCPDTLRIMDGMGGCIPASLELSAANTRATLTPDDPLTAGNGYRLRAEGGPGGIADLAGNLMAGDPVYTFTVSSALDSTPPRVISIYPKHRYEDVPLGAAIVVAFSEAVEPGSVGIDTVSLTAPAGAITVTRALSAGNTILTLTPRSLLAPGTEFSVTLLGSGSAFVTDRAGNALDGDGDTVAGGSFVAIFETTLRPSRDGSFTIQENVTPGFDIAVSLNDRDLNTSGAPDTFELQAQSTTGEVETLTLIETLGSSGVFEGTVGTRFAIGSGTDNDGVFNTQEADVITFTYLDALGSDGMPHVIEAEVLVLASPAAIGVSPLVLTTSEAGGIATFEVSLGAQPTANVTVNFDSNDTSEGIVSTTSLTFTTSNYRIPQSVFVTGVDDDVVDGDQSYAIVFSATVSTDGAYAAIIPADIAVTNSDDDVASFDISLISGDTNEAGGTATFSIALTSEPLANVTIDFDSTTTTEGTVSVTTASFGTADWDVAQTITVTGVNDDIDDGDRSYAIAFAPATSSDGDYDTLDPADVQVTNIDDDTAGFAVSAISNPTDEDGGSGTFSVVLDSEPLDNVTLSFDSSDTTEGVVGATSLTFTPADWDVAQTVTVTGVDDDVDDDASGPVTYTIAFSSVTSNDPLYPFLTPSALLVTNIDDDSAGITVTLISGPTTETGGTATFAIGFTSEPMAQVTLILTVVETPDCVAFPPCEGSVVSPLLFQPTTDDWTVPLLATVTGLSDAVSDPAEPYEVEVASASGDMSYVLQTPLPRVTIINEELGASGAADVMPTGFTLGTSITLRVTGDTDPSANAAAGAGNDSVSVTVTSGTDSETIVLQESDVFAGWYDCIVDGCILATAESGSVTADNGLLETSAGATVTLTYIDAIDSTGAAAVSVTDTATANATSPCATGILINEIVTDPQQDWNDTVGGDGVPYNATPGTGHVDMNDEWIELYNASGGPCDLTGYRLHLLDGSDYTYEFGVTADGQTLVFSAGGSVAAFGAGEYLVIGDVAGSDALEDDAWIRLDESATGGIVDEVALGSSPGGDASTGNNAPPGTSTGVADEAAARSPNGADTDADNVDWASVAASIGTVNP